MFQNNVSCSMYLGLDVSLHNYINVSGDHSRYKELAVYSAEYLAAFMLYERLSYVHGNNDII